jgi:tRNA (cytidine32/uridine32-2'-O)-methyltransferase
VQFSVRIVLVETSHPGNIGASARAMKTMGFEDLALVRPGAFPSPEASARASGADDILVNARVVGSLDEAIGECGYVVGASARLRSLPMSTVDPRACAGMLWERAANNKVAVVFGPEQSGLTNEHLGRCQQLVHIPANETFSSLNLAMAVQVLCYEMRMANLALTGRHAPSESRAARLASAAELEGFHRHLEEVLSAAGFLHSDHPKQLRLKLRRIFQRAQLDENEINILRGVLSALDPGKRRVPSASSGKE